jgi:hypothetical protein
MYERFTDRAIKVMQLANEEAIRFGHEYIGTEHILLGLVKEGSGVAANALKYLNCDLVKIRAEVAKIVQPGNEDRMDKLPLTPRAKKVVEYAIEEARKLNHNYVGTEHLLLGLLREEEGVAVQVLMNLGLKLHDARNEVLQILGEPTDAQPHQVQDVGSVRKEYEIMLPYRFPEGPAIDHEGVVAIVRRLHVQFGGMVRELEWHFGNSWLMTDDCCQRTIRILRVRALHEGMEPKFFERLIECLKTELKLEHILIVGRPGY